MTEVETRTVAHVRSLVGQRVTLGDAGVLSASIDDLGFDSLDSMELVMKLEEEFDVELDEDAVVACKGVSDLVLLVEAARASK